MRGVCRTAVAGLFQPPLPPPPRPWWKLWGKDPEIELPAIGADLRNIA